jgi:putative membrane protein
MGLCMGWYWPVMMLLFWTAVIAVTVFIVRWLIMSARKGRGTQEESALDILKKRYARGDINEDESEKIRKDIQ